MELVVILVIVAARDRVDRRRPLPLPALDPHRPWAARGADPPDADAARSRRRRSPPPEATTAPPVEPEVVEPEVVEPETVEPVERVKPRLRDRLGKTRAAFAGAFTGIAGRGKVDDETWDDLEEALILADVGVPTTTKVIDAVRARAKEEKAGDPERVIELLREELVTLLADADRELHFGDATPSVWMFVGVNGVGKTTSIAKLAQRETDDGRRVVLAAADTFRAAAAEQLATWADRTGTEIVRGQEGADPGSVVFDAMSAATTRGADLVLVDTAGRLHTKVNLMEELKKLRRIVDRTEGALVRGAARDRRVDRSERTHPGPPVRGGGRRHRRGAHEARRHRQGRDRARDPVRARDPGEGRGHRRDRRRPRAVRPRGVRRRASDPIPCGSTASTGWRRGSRRSGRLPSCSPPRRSASNEFARVTGRQERVRILGGHMFDALSDRFDGIFSKLRSRGKLTEADIDAVAREIRLALLEADVNVRVVKSLIARVKERANGAEVQKSLTPAQQVIKIVHEELITTLGGDQASSR